MKQLEKLKNETEEIVASYDDYSHLSSSDVANEIFRVKTILLLIQVIETQSKALEFYANNITVGLDYSYKKDPADVYKYLLNYVTNEAIEAQSAVTKMLGHLK